MSTSKNSSDLRGNTFTRALKLHFQPSNCFPKIKSVLHVSYDNNNGKDSSVLCTHLNFCYQFLHKIGNNYNEL